MTAPLVSVIVYNYNYGKYLNECLRSIFLQTYEHIEVLFSDNGSTDDSWEIAQNWLDKKLRPMFVARNHTNFGTDSNLLNCSINIRGKYVLIVGSDDTIDRSYVETAVKLMEQHTSVKMLIVNRNEMDSLSNIRKEAPFFNKNCIIQPPGLSFVYSVAAINPSITQVFYSANEKKFYGNDAGDMAFGAENYATRILDFLISLNHDVMYLTHAFVNHRIHGENQSLEATKSLNEVIGPYILSKMFLSNIEKSDYSGDARIQQYREKVVTQYSSLAIRYALRETGKSNLLIAKQYMYLAAALNPEVDSGEEWRGLFNFHYQSAKKNKQVVNIEAFSKKLFNRTISYDPPDPYVVIDIASETP